LVRTNESAFSNVTKIVVRDVTDLSGLGYDDFSFTAGVQQVPEPAALSIVGAGLLAGLALARRHRKTA
jgi:hypothetical protein